MPFVKNELSDIFRKSALRLWGLQGPSVAQNMHEGYRTNCWSWGDSTMLYGCRNISEFSAHFRTILSESLWDQIRVCSQQHALSAVFVSKTLLNTRFPCMEYWQSWYAMILHQFVRLADCMHRVWRWWTTGFCPSVARNTCASFPRRCCPFPHTDGFKFVGEVHIGRQTSPLGIWSRGLHRQNSGVAIPNVTKWIKSNHHVFRCCDGVSFFDVDMRFHWCYLAATYVLLSLGLQEVA